MVVQGSRSFPKDYDLHDEVYTPHGHEERAFTYSDGDDAETYLLDVIGNATDRSILSQELTAGIRDWPSQYHLSPKRANLLRPFAASLRGSVLEVGAGCGAITRFLGENGADVVAIEGSMRRARIARKRTSDLKNVKVVCEQLDRFVSPSPFDAILSIGVLEYAAIYGNGHPRPHVRFLENLRQQLSPDGVVILAIENKLGLKYFAGAREDHVGSEFHGINDGYGDLSVATFGRSELADLLTEAGLPAQAFFYPCPDYKLPTTLLSDPLLEQHSHLASTLLAQSARFDQQKPSDPTFSLEQGWSSLAPNHLLGELANSFLVVAARNEEALTPYTDAPALAWHYSIDRHPAFAREVRFERAENGLDVRRSILSDVVPPHVPVECILTDEPLFQGDNWWNVLSSIVNKPNWSIQQLSDWARPWLDAVARECGLPAFETSSLARAVAGAHFDLAPFNMVRSKDGEIHFFDQEWHLKPQLEFGYVIYRGLRDSFARLTSCAAPAQGTPIRINDIIVNVLAYNGALLSRADVDRYAVMEGQIQSWVQGRPSSDMTLADAEHAWAGALTERLSIKRNVLTQQIQSLRDNLNATEVRLNIADTERQALTADIASTRQDLDSQRVRAERLAQLVAERDQSLAATTSLLSESQTQTQRLSGELAVVSDALSAQRAETVRNVAQSNILAQKVQDLEQKLAYEENARKSETLSLKTQLSHVRDAHSRDVKAAQSQAGELSVKLAVQAREIDKLARSQFRWPFSRVIERIGHTLSPWKRTLYRQRSWEAGIIKDSRLFRPAWYLEQNPDVAKAGIDPLLHYILHGGAEGRSPHPLFDSHFYTNQVPEAERTAMTPLAHYASAGAALGLDPHPLFDTKFYLRANPDVAAAGINPLFHYVEYGWREGRDPNPLFSTSYYLERNPDLATSGINPLVHYLMASRPAASPAH